MGLKDGTDNVSATKGSHTSRVISVPAPLSISDDDLYARIAQRAYELYQQRGEEPGHDLEDWFTAEQLVKAELLHGPAPEEPLLVEEE